jgi:hypothetical protein
VHLYIYTYALAKLKLDNADDLLLFFQLLFFLLFTAIFARATRRN